MTPAEHRQAQAEDAPKRRYEDVKAASASAADRIGQATEKLIGSFQKAFAPEYNRPLESHQNTAAE